MRNLIITLLLIVTTIGTAWAQKTTITGKVVSSEDNLPVIGALIRLNASDSTKSTLQARVTVTDINGNFTIISRTKTSDITISYNGYDNFFAIIEPGKSVTNFDKITLQQRALKIEAVVIGQGRLAQIKGDTVQYNASNFKTNPDATAEDLLKKMPGVVTESDGSVSSQGQKIAKILVDGKEFFKDDPSLALRSLPSDAVASVEVFDGKSDDSKFSGFDDGERIRTVNIITKAGIGSSMFGRVYTAFGTDDRYASGVGLNFFNGDHRWSIVAQTNNVNNQGFNLSDVVQSTGGGGSMRRMRSQGMDIGSFMTSAWGGIRKTEVFALNYSGTLSPQFNLSGSYTFGNYNADSDTETTKDYRDPQSPLYQYQRSTNHSVNNRHNLTLRSEWTPTSTNKINFNPRISVGSNNGNSITTMRNDAGLGGDLINSADNRYNTSYDNIDASVDLWWQHAFTKLGRTISVGGVVSAIEGSGDRDQYSSVEKQMLPANIIQIIDQIGNLDQSSYTYTASSTYTEPLSAKSSISANYNYNYNRTKADIESWNLDEILQQYITPDISTTNYLTRNYTTQTTGLNYGYVNGKKVTLNLGVDYLMAVQNNDQEFLTAGQIKSENTFRSVQPSVRLRLTPKAGQNLNIDVRGYSGFPGVIQLQDVLNITNPLEVVKGNPDLDQSYSTRFNASYSVANMEHNTSLNLGISGTQTNNYIASNRKTLTEDLDVNGVVLSKGTQYTTYENIDGYWNAMVNGNFSFKIKPLLSNMNIMAFYRYSRVPSIRNDVKYLSTDNSINLGISLTSNVSESVDFTLRYDPSLTLSEPGIGGFQRYYGHNFTGIANIYLTKRLFINADASWLNSFGTSGQSQHYTLLNAAIGYKVMKNRQGEFKIQGYDLLNQNQSYSQSMNEIYLQTTNNFTILKQYFMVSFTYKFDTRKSSNRNKSVDQGDQPMPNSMPGGMMPGSGPGGGGGRP